MPKLVRRQALARGLQNRTRDLLREHGLGLVTAALSGKEPQLIRVAQQHGSMLMRVLLDQGREVLIEHELELEPILHVIVREDQPVGPVWPRGTDQVLLEPDPEGIRR